MKGLKTLIRLAKDDVDKRRKELAEIEERQRGYIDERTRLEQELERETAAATEFPETAITFADYLAKNKKRREDLTRTILQLQKVIDKKRDELLDAFGEQKKLEISLERKLEEARQAEIKREQLQMDEIAGRKKATQ
jgi:flagellar FliJ protein